MARILRVQSLLHRPPRGRHAAPRAGWRGNGAAGSAAGSLTRRVAAVVPVLALATTGAALATTSGSGPTAYLRVPGTALTEGASPAYPSAGPVPAPMQLPPVYDTFTRQWDRVDVGWSAQPVLDLLGAAMPVRIDAHGIPAAALAAYRAAADRLRQAAPGCGLDWALLGAIGRVESNHARFGGNALDANGIARPGVFGPPLDGRPGTARITDTDGGRWDRDAVYDRAVGPMQFIPGTWRSVAVDGDGDGVVDPQSLPDAATAAGVYLCSGHAELGSPSGAHRAVLRYNHSEDYARTVLSIADAYRHGVTVVPVSALPAARPAPGDGAATPSGSGFAWGGSDGPRTESARSGSGSANAGGASESASQSAQPEPTPAPADEPAQPTTRPGRPGTGTLLPGLPLPTTPLPLPTAPTPTSTASTLPPPTSTALMIEQLLSLPHLPALPGDPAGLVRVLDPSTAALVCILDAERVDCPGGLPG